MMLNPKAASSLDYLRQLAAAGIKDQYAAGIVSGNQRWGGIGVLSKKNWESCIPA